MRNLDGADGAILATLMPTVQRLHGQRGPLIRWTATLTPHELELLRGWAQHQDAWVAQILPRVPELFKKRNG
jgi:hypothetical protein